jgi:hypothetical protein
VQCAAQGAAAAASDAGRKLQREFVYFHHIYNKQKRRDIVGWGRELNLTGFSVVGKPGLVCAEGAEEDVREYLQRLRRLPWQKIQSKVGWRAGLFCFGRERRYELLMCAPPRPQCVVYVLATAGCTDRDGRGGPDPGHAATFSAPAGARHCGPRAARKPRRFWRSA